MAKYTSFHKLQDGTSQPANEHTRKMWGLYHSGQWSVEAKRFWREFNRDHTRRDVLGECTASEWLAFQRRELIVFWPRGPRTRQGGFAIV